MGPGKATPALPSYSPPRRCPRRFQHSSQVSRPAPRPPAPSPRSGKAGRGSDSGKPPVTPGQESGARRAVSTVPGEAGGGFLAQAPGCHFSRARVSHRPCVALVAGTRRLCLCSWTSSVSISSGCTDVPGLTRIHACLRPTVGGTCLGLPGLGRC